ncbi:MAG: DUF3810 family protein [Clostridiales bacterium]|nr:DUF3810 family protein [Clostridiales bacterium]
MKRAKRNKGIIFLKILHIPLMLLLIALIITVVNNLPEDAANYYSETIFPYISMIPNMIMDTTHISVTENLVVAGSLTLVILLIMFIFILIKNLFRKKFWKVLYETGARVVALGLVLTIIFELMHGINYRRTSVLDHIRKEERVDYTYEEMLDTFIWAYRGMVSSREKLGEDYAGVAHLQDGFENNVMYANLLIDEFAAKEGIKVSPTYIRVKPVALSRYWSLTHIVGMYCPFLGESVVNTDYMNVYDFPVDLCHEIVHAKGFAREYDATSMAVLACLSSNRDDFRYSGFYRVYWDLYDDVFAYAESLGEKKPDFMDQKRLKAVYRDMDAERDHWEFIDSMFKAKEISEVSSKANNTFLEANGQAGGVKTYKVPVNIYVDYYLKLKREKDARDKTY